MVRTVETAAALAHRNPSRAALSPRMRRRPAAGVEQVRGPYRAYALHALLVGAGMNTLLVMPRESGASTAASVLFDRPVVTGSPAFAGDDDSVDQLHSRTSTKWPAIATASAITGETRCVRPRKPWRPSKLRFEVEAQRSPGKSLSGFMARHMEQPGSRPSKPALTKILSSPSASA